MFGNKRNAVGVFLSSVWYVVPPRADHDKTMMGIVQRPVHDAKCNQKIWGFVFPGFPTLSLRFAAKECTTRRNKR